jgi:hypothetical protein
MCATEMRYATGMPESGRPLRRRAIYQVRFWQHLRYVACLEVGRHASHRHTTIRMKTKVLLLVDFIDKFAILMRLRLHAQPQGITASNGHEQFPARPPAGLSLQIWFQFGAWLDRHDWQ